MHAGGRFIIHYSLPEITLLLKSIDMFYIYIQMNIKIIKTYVGMLQMSVNLFLHWFTAR